ncbi:hypothetical protein VNO77_09295 [Canavalia gladiata]|uniref:Uncharacterized protein n=1 Tax=Canavalia gladiata TaxID=3824 RepID=A0AAN9R1D7_CANGL
MLLCMLIGAMFCWGWHKELDILNASTHEDREWFLESWSRTKRYFGSMSSFMEDLIYELFSFVYVLNTDWLIDLILTF